MFISRQSKDVCAADHRHLMLQKLGKIEIDFIGKIPHLRAPLAFTCVSSSILLAAVHGMAVKGATLQGFHIAPARP